MPDTEGKGTHIEDDEPVLANTALDIFSDAVTGVPIPTPIKQNAFKAFSRLCSAAIEVPVAYLEGIAAEKRAETNARVKLIETNASQIARQLEVDPEYARVAVRKFGQRIIREQVNLDMVSEEAARQLAKQEALSAEAGGQEVKEIDDDWLNQFEREASQKSTEEMQRLFGRILAGEISRPSSYSIRTIKILGELDTQVAQLFQKFCSASISIQIPTTGLLIVDARVPSLGGNASHNALQQYGFAYATLNKLNEYGLIISDYNSWFDYGLLALANENNQVLSGFSHQNQLFGLIPNEKWGQKKEVKVSGVGFSEVGKELLSIIDVIPVPNYTKDLKEFFLKQNLVMTPVIPKDSAE